MNSDDNVFNSFKDLYNDNEAFVRKSLYYIIHNPNKVDEVVQEVFIKIWKYKSKFRGESSLKTWVHRITLNCAYDYLRKEKRHKTVDIEKNPEMEGRAEANTLENEQLILKAINQLTPKQKGPFVLFYIQELPLKEISKALKVPEGTLKSRLHKSREVVTSFLRQQGVKL